MKKSADAGLSREAERYNELVDRRNALLDLFLDYLEELVSRRRRGERVGDCISPYDAEKIIEDASVLHGLINEVLEKQLDLDNPPAKKKSAGKTRKRR